MSKIRSKLNGLSQTEREAGIREIIVFFKKERDEEIGVIAAEVVLDFFLEHIGKSLYNQGLFQAKMMLQKRFEDLEVDLDLLFK
ncbi:TPA: DUF2164 domain-containing protein [Candidatus Uhrbacteria bacterium]|nr:DUF2164 domain-containing protein [Candidatus Uhrbacteria bacterium]HCU31575.1 DUF2164 domain-containing protein [Candidatus Uhrbacteria bacterium]